MGKIRNAWGNLPPVKQWTAASLALVLSGMTAYGVTALATGDGGDVTTKEPVTASPSTHINTTGEALVVKIDNVRAARPSTGVQHAKYVYVEQVEGGLTRIMAVFGSDNLPAVVGPVRSARETDLDIMKQFGKPAFAYSGARSQLLPQIAKASVYNLSHNNASRYYTRHNDRYAPHNLYLNPRALLSSVKASPLIVSSGPVPSNGTVDKSVSVQYPNASYSFAWTGLRYNVSMDGRPAVNTDAGRSYAKTVVVQHVPHTPPVYGSPGSPYARTIGAGKAEVYRDGKRFDANWKRVNASHQTEYTVNGKRIDFATGQTWILLVR
jgi:hypothetical protein